MTTRQFFLRLIIFLAPILAYMGITMGFPLLVGEYMPLPHIVDLQERDEVLFARGYRDDFVPFKFLSVIQRRPDLLILGSSRVMQFRAGLFERIESGYYNAGGGAANIYEVRDFLFALPKDVLPRTLILGIDQDWFSPANSSSVARPQKHPLGLTFEFAFNDVMNYSRQLLLSITRNPDYLESLIDATFSHAATTEQIGVKAVTEGIGFRSDGSIRYSDEVIDLHSTETRLRETNLRLDTGGLRFEFASDYSREPLATLHELLAYCAANDIQVIAFFPPYAPSIYARMMEEGKYGYLAELTPVLGELFGQYGYSISDFADGSVLSAQGDDNFVDGFHGGERVYAALTVALYEREPEVLSSYVDRASLENRLAHPTGNPLLLFDKSQVTSRQTNSEN